MQIGFCMQMRILFSFLCNYPRNLNGLFLPGKVIEMASNCTLDYSHLSWMGCLNWVEHVTLWKTRKVIGRCVFESHSRLEYFRMQIFCLIFIFTITFSYNYWLLERSRLRCYHRDAICRALNACRFESCNSFNLKSKLVVLFFLLNWNSGRGLRAKLLSGLKRLQYPELRSLPRRQLHMALNRPNYLFE